MSELANVIRLPIFGRRAALRDLIEQAASSGVQVVVFNGPVIVQNASGGGATNNYVERLFGWKRV